MCIGDPERPWDDHDEAYMERLVKKLQSEPPRLSGPFWPLLNRIPYVWGLVKSLGLQLRAALSQLEMSKTQVYVLRDMVDKHDTWIPFDEAELQKEPLAGYIIITRKLVDGESVYGCFFWADPMRNWAAEMYDQGVIDYQVVRAVREPQHCRVCHRLPRVEQDISRTFWIAECKLDIGMPGATGHLIRFTADSREGAIDLWNANR